MNFTFNDEKMFMDISDGIAVIINIETGIYYGMNSFSTMVFEALTKGMAEEDIKTALEKLEGCPSRVMSDMETFTNNLRDYEIIIPGEAGEYIEMNGQIAKNDDYLLEVKAYEDAKEMLLADPIHEVKENTGWTPEKESIGYSKEETREREEKIIE